MSVSESNKRGRLNRWAGRLINRRLVLWLWSVAVIALLSAALGAIFWLTRMKATYEVEITAQPRSPEWSDGRSHYLMTIPRQKFQAIRTGDPAEIAVDAGGWIRGKITDVEARESSLGLTIYGCWSFGPNDKKPAGFARPDRGRLTLRALRLIAAFQR